MAQTVSNVTVYRWRAYDISSDEKRESRRWATREAVEKLGGEVLEDTATQVDASVVDTDIPGMTERGFDPHPHVGFQRQVTA